MSYTAAKFILWILLAVPVFCLCVFFCNSLLDDAIGITKEKERKARKQEAERRRREEFESEFNRRRGGY